MTASGHRSPLRPPGGGATPDRGERGVVAGADGLAIGILVLLVGTLLVVQLWSAVTTRATLDEAAAEYLRAWTAAADPASAQRDGQAALTAALAGSRIRTRSLEVTGPDPSRFGPCAPAEVTVAATVPALRVPVLGVVGSLRVRAHHAEMVPPHREVVAGAAFDPAGTPCGR